MVSDEDPQYLKYSLEPVLKAEELFATHEKSKLTEAKEILEEHLKKYPEDLFARGLYGSIVCELKDI